MLGLLCQETQQKPNMITNTIRVWKIRRIRIWIYSVLKNHPNTNTNTIRFENICQIRIRISIFGPNYLNPIRIPKYLLTSDMCDISLRLSIVRSLERKVQVGISSSGAQNTFSWCRENCWEAFCKGYESWQKACNATSTSVQGHSCK